MAFFTGGEGQPNCSIAVARLDPTSDRWTPGTLASRVTNQSSQNPVLFWDNDAQLLRLFHTVQARPPGEATNKKELNLKRAEQNLLPKGAGILVFLHWGETWVKRNGRSSLLARAVASVGGAVVAHLHDRLE